MNGETRRCIYCLETKRIGAFDREHVIPQAFGTFDSATPVLDCVCKSCNGDLGKELDEKLARDSLEALDRVAAGLKKAAKFQTVGKRSTLHVEFDKEGPLKGAKGHHVPDPAGGEKLAVAPNPQLGFSMTEDGPVEWFPLHETWTKDDVRQRLGVERGVNLCVHTWGVPAIEGQDELERRGFNRGTLEREIQPPSGHVKTTVVGLITAADFRAIAKIAFNYLTFIAGPNFVLEPQFNEIRRFVRQGVPLPWESVKPTPNPWLVTNDNDNDKPLVGHYVIIRTRGRDIECDVCLLMRTRYRVKLAAGGFLTPVSVNSGHLFDVVNRRALRIPSDQFPAD
jgi:hypothetical protein